MRQVTASVIGQIPGLGPDLKRAMKIQSCWSEIVGKGLEGQVTFLKIDGRRIVLGALDHMMAQEIELLAPELLGRIRETTGDRFQGVRCRVLTTLPGPATPEIPRAPATADAPLPEESARILESALEQVEDSGLRDQLRRILVKGFHRNRAGSPDRS